MKPNTRIWALPILWAASIFGTSSTVVHSQELVRGVSRAVGGRLSESDFNHFWHHWWWVFVKGWHVFEFATLFLLLQLALRRSSRLPFSKAQVWAALASAAYAASDEFHQTFVSDRGGKVSDVLIDCIGIASMLILVLPLHVLSTRRHAVTDEPTPVDFNIL